MQLTLEEAVEKKYAGLQHWRRSDEWSQATLPREEQVVLQKVRQLEEQLRAEGKDSAEAEIEVADGVRCRIAVQLR